MAVTSSVIEQDSEQKAGFVELAAMVDSAATNTLVEPITLERAKLHLRVVNPDEDDYILALIIAARHMAEGRLNRTLVQRQLTATFTSMHERMMLLKPPVVSVDSVQYVDADGAVQEFSDFELIGGEVSVVHGVTPPASRYRPDAIRVTYTAGYPLGEIPQPIIQWMLLSIGTMYDHRATIVNGTISQPLADDFVRWLLQPYMVYE